MNDKIDAFAFSREIRQRIPKPDRTMAPVRWYGGKGNMAKKIVQLIPSSKIYVEPYCGAASIFWHLKPRPIEVLNDLNEELITLFRVLQDKEQFEELAHRLTWTPYSRSEFVRALEVDRDAADIDVAWATMVKFCMGMSGFAKTFGNWSRTFIESRGMPLSCSRWRACLRLLDWWHDRISRVQLECNDALTVIDYWDTPDTTFYIDPPYVSSSRVSQKVYDYETEDEHHRKLVSLLLQVKGNVVLSGYANEIYEPLEQAGWRRVDFQTACYARCRHRNSNLVGEGAATKHVPRTESAWIKPTKKQSGMLF